MPFLLSCHAVVILVPTRELALQTSQVCKELAKHLQIQVMVTTGGTSLKDDIMRLYQPVHLLVGTPGRILDLAKKGVCVLKDCSMLVMDEVKTVYQIFTNFITFVEKYTIVNQMRNYDKSKECLILSDIWSRFYCFCLVC